MDALHTLDDLFLTYYDLECNNSYLFLLEHVDKISKLHLYVVTALTFCLRKLSLNVKDTYNEMLKTFDMIVLYFE